MDPRGDKLGGIETHVSALATALAEQGAEVEVRVQDAGARDTAPRTVDGVTVRVEMQTASSKALLAEFGGPDQRLSVGESLEQVVSHEIKELGQHVLGCTVAYRMPPGMRPPVGQSADPQDSSIQSFRKFYKFAVSK